MISGAGRVVGGRRCLVGSNARYNQFLEIENLNSLHFQRILGFRGESWSSSHSMTDWPLEEVLSCYHQKGML